MKIRDLGINAIPSGGFRMAACDNNTYNPQCADCTMRTDCADCTTTVCGEEDSQNICDNCTATGKPGGYRASFTDDAIAQLRQQLDYQMGQQLEF